MLHATLLATVLALQGQSQFPTKHVIAKPEPGKVVAKVDGAEITAGELDQFVWDWAAKAAVEDLIVYKLVLAEADRLGIKLTEAEVDAEFQKQMVTYQQDLPQGKTADDALAERYYSRSRIYLGLRREMLITKITDREFKASDYVKVSTIAVKPADSSADAIGKAITTMNGVYDRLKKGDKWEVVLKTVTTDQRVVESNGLIGWRSLSAFPESVQTELKALKAGDYTKPAQTPFGIQVFRIDAKGESVKPEELGDLKGQFLASARQALVTRLRDKAKIERFLGK